jgi:hypothetical protein
MLSDDDGKVLKVPEYLPMQGHVKIIPQKVVIHASTFQHAQIDVLVREL